MISWSEGYEIIIDIYFTFTHQRSYLYFLCEKLVK